MPGTFWHRHAEIPQIGEPNERLHDKKSKIRELKAKIKAKIGELKELKADSREELANFESNLQNR